MSEKLQGRLAYGRIQPVSVSLVKKSARRKVMLPAHAWLVQHYSPADTPAASLVSIIFCVDGIGL